MELRVWILTSVLGIVLLALGFLLKTQFRQILEKLDELVDEMKRTSQISAVQEQQIGNLSQQVNQNRKRMDNHSERIRNLELKNR